MTKRTLRIAATLLFGAAVALGIVQLSAAPALAAGDSCVAACIAMAVAQRAASGVADSSALCSEQSELS